ncbi:hypothetical protein [Rhodanobacter lindaniclasticus]
MLFSNATSVGGSGTIANVAGDFADDWASRRRAASPTAASVR